ncbi:hypothetical protein GQR58_008218 [Nymphon striatum]|nr:hypothetical protein GQR58_008218 [Nymphon striatum]
MEEIGYYQKTSPTFEASTNNVEYIWLYKIMLIGWIIFGLAYLSTILTFISHAMQSKKLKSVVEDRITKKFNRFKVVVLDNARSRTKRSTRRQRNAKSVKVSKKHRRSRSLDFDATFNENSKGSSSFSPKWHVKGIIDPTIEASEESLSVENDLYVPSKRRWFSILEKHYNNNLAKSYKGSLSNQLKKSYSANNSPSSQFNLSEVMDSKENVTSITDVDDRDADIVVIDTGLITVAKGQIVTPVTVESFIQTIEDAKATEL